MLELTLLETNIETSKLRLLLTLNTKESTKPFEEGINGKNKGFMDVERKTVD